MDLVPDLISCSLEKCIYPSDCYESDYDQSLRNVYGCLRWDKIRSAYLLGDISLGDVFSCYDEWVDDTEYLTLENIKDGGLLFLKCAKRGNDVYQRRVEEILQPIRNIETKCFIVDDFYQAQKKTKLLFITLTTDTKKYSLNESWENVGIDWNRFKSNLQKAYKSKIETFRTWESTKNGYAHIHVLVGFVDHEFVVFRHKEKDGSVSYRIPFNDVKKIGSFWHSFIKVNAVGDTKGAVNELVKYVTKELCSEKGSKTNAMICLFNKQSYAVSKHFLTLLEAQFIKKSYEKLKKLKNYDFSEDRTNSITEVLHNSNLDPSDFRFVGILRGRSLHLHSKLWVLRVKKPPPQIVEMVEFEKQRQYVLKGGRF